MTTPNDEWIFISYRRKDSAGHARNIFDRLKREFGGSHVYFDTESNDAGVNFPDRLTAAVLAARVVVVVIGPDWLGELERRARHAGEIDFVRAEIELALQPDAEGRQRLVIPVYMAGTPPIEASSLSAALRDDLGTLLSKHAPEITDSAWEAGYEKLRAAIAAVPRRGSTDYRAMAQRIAKSVQLCLAKPELDALRGAWTPKVEDGVLLGNATDLLLDMSKGIQNIETAWRTPSNRPGSDAVRAQFARQCREIAVDLLRLSVDPAAARRWIKVRGTAPIEGIGMAGVVRAVALDEALEVDAKPMEDDFLPQRHAELDDVLDKGAGQKRKEQLAQAFWRHAYPEPPSGPFDDRRIEKLATKIRMLTRRDGWAFVVTARIDDDSQRAALNTLATGFNADALLRQPLEQQDILSEPEGDLAAAFCLCLQEINGLS